MQSQFHCYLGVVFGRSMQAQGVFATFNHVIVQRILIHAVKSVTVDHPTKTIFVQGTDHLPRLTSLLRISNQPHLHSIYTDTWLVLE